MKGQNEMQDKHDLLDMIWKLYREENEWMRHNENQRARIVSLILIIETALATFLTTSNNAIEPEWIIPTLMIFVGTVGTVVVFKYWERFNFHMNIERQYRSAMDCYFLIDNHAIIKDQLGPEGKGNVLIRIRESGKRKHNKTFKYKFVKDNVLRQHMLWIVIMLLFVAFGISLLIF